MKKRILLLTFILLLTGCKAEYNLNIIDDDFEEKINITIPKSDKNQIDYYTENDELIGENIIYNKNIKDNGINKMFIYSHKYTLKEYQNRNNPCFANSKISEEDGYYSIYASDFVCFKSFDVQAKEYKINIKTNYNVINENADKKSNNIYTWNFNENNFKNKNIIFQYTKQKKSLHADYLSLFITFLISIIIFSLLVIFQIAKNKQKVEV